MNARRRLVLSALTTIGALLGALGCAGSGPSPTAAASASAPASAPAGFGGTDLAWIEITIAMDEQLLPLLTLAPERGGDPTVTALAGQVRTFTETELAALRSLHDEAGLPAQNPHEGMTMPGMVTADEVAQAAKLTGRPFDAFARQKIAEASRQGKSLAESEQRYGVEPRTRALAANAVSARTRTLSSLPG